MLAEDMHVLSSSTVQLELDSQLTFRKAQCSTCSAREKLKMRLPFLPAGTPSKLTLQFRNTKRRSVPPDTIAQLAHMRKSHAQLDLTEIRRAVRMQTIAVSVLRAHTVPLRVQQPPLRVPWAISVLKDLRCRKSVL